jgi:hypothetical protein
MFSHNAIRFDLCTGIGGGMVLGPLLVALGCLPQPVAATSAYVVLITATSGLVQVIIFGLLPYDYAGVFAVLGLLSTFVGQTVSFCFFVMHCRVILTFFLDAGCGLCCQEVQKRCNRCPCYWCDYGHWYVHSMSATLRPLEF